MLPYNINIPFATNSPSTDQPKMEENTNSINTLIQQDHFGFNGEFNANPNSGGWHTLLHMVDQVTDPASSITNVGQLYARNVTFNGKTDVALFYRTGTVIGSANSITQITAPKNTVGATNGYTFLPGGIILQWGVEAVPTGQHVFGGTSFFLNYTNVFAVILSPQVSSNAVTKQATVSLNGTSTSSFTWNYVRADTSGDYPAFNWLAIGN